MTNQNPSEAAAPDLGELALAIVFEDLKARVSKAELSEGEAKTIVEAALDRFPADMHPELHALIAR